MFKYMIFLAISCTCLYCPPMAKYLDGEALLKYRLEAGLEQADLAAMVGTIQPAVSGWERGSSGCRLPMLHKLAGALDKVLRAKGHPGCTPSDLLLPAAGTAPGMAATLKSRRIEAGLELRAAAARAGISHDYLAALERGDRSAGPKALAALAALYGCETAEFTPALAG
jgi:transcriptional regulator with XRE-family HTH domain